MVFSVPYTKEQSPISDDKGPPQPFSSLPHVSVVPAERYVCPYRTS